MQIQAFATKQAKANLEPYEFESPSPQDHDCLIKVIACGICQKC